MVPYTGDPRMGLMALLLILLSVGASGGAFVCTLLIKNIIRKLKEKRAENKTKSENNESEQ